MLQKLKPEAKQWIKEDQELQLLIAKLFDKRNIITVQRWLANDNPVLTLPGVLDIIRKHKGISEEVELTVDREVATI